MNTKKIGDIGEEKAAQFLKRKGYNILDRNYRCRFGEIDIIAHNKECYIFVEVKTRKDESFGRPIESISRVKISRILKTLKFYLAQNKIYDSDIRVDAIEVIMKNPKDIKINHIENIVC
ncbi:YraN family protein [Wukongibacter baidiensis]|uniref:YraN family protein n=1 Tax=Wukongibacter baidiensis TaxID=1723361 RepID=UPI003D7F6321